jgi:prefoldin subunit 5
MSENEKTMQIVTEQWKLSSGNAIDAIKHKIMSLNDEIVETDKKLRDLNSEKEQLIQSIKDFAEGL